MKLDHSVHNAGENGAWTNQINDFPEVHLYGTLVQIWVVGRIVDEFRKFALTHLRSAVPKDKQQ